MAFVGGERDEFVTSLAALILYDGEVELSADNINTLLNNSNNTGVKPYWPALFAGALKGGRIESVIFSGGAVGGDSGAAAAPAAAEAAAPAAAPAAKEKPKAEEVDALDGGMDMFGGGAKGGDY